MNQTAESMNNILHIDIGSVNTRVCLFEKVKGTFSFVGAASSKTARHNPDRSEYLSVVEAIQKLERAARRKILDRNQRIVMPAAFDRTGLDQVAVSFSCVEDPRILIMGLTRSGSLAALDQLLLAAGVRSAAEICLEDGKAVTEHLDTILNVAPRLAIIAGGTESGSEKSVYRLAEILLLACRSLPREQRPAILYLGNSAAKEQLDRVFSKLTDFVAGSNLLMRANGTQSSLNGLVNALRRDAERVAPGLQLLRENTKCSMVPAAFAFGRNVRLMSRLIKQNQHVLGVDIGSGQTIFADAVNLRLNLQTVPLGVGTGMERTLDQFSAAEVQSRIGFQIKTTEIEDYVRNKSFYPDLIPANSYSAEIEQAVARCILWHGVRKAGLEEVLSQGSLSTVFLSGALLRNVEDPGEALQIAMDGFLPAGVVDYLLDMNGLAAAIGSLAHVNPHFVSQIMNASTYLNLGKVIRPLLRADASGKTLMTIALKDDSGNSRNYEIPAGRIFRIPLEYGKNYELNWVNVGRQISLPGVKTWATLGFKSGCFGLVFDTRPVLNGKLRLPKERTAQMSRIEEWKKMLGPWKLTEEEEQV